MPIAWCYGREFRVDFLDPENGSRWAVVIPHEPLPISEELRESRITMYERLTRSERAASQLEFPDHLPFVDSAYDLLWDSQGRLWVQEFRDHTAEGAPYRYQVFSGEGEWLFRQDLDHHAWIISDDGYYSREHDGEGAPIVRFYRFEAAPTA